MSEQSMRLERLVNIIKQTPQFYTKQDVSQCQVLFFKSIQRQKDSTH